MSHRHEPGPSRLEAPEHGRTLPAASATWPAAPADVRPTAAGAAPAPGTDPPEQQFWHDRALPFVESRRACASRACYRAHLHPTYSIGAVDAGTSVFTGAGDAPVRLHPGSVVFVPAERVHACNPAPDTAWSYQMLHLDAAWLQAVRREHDQTTTDEPVRVV